MNRLVAAAITLGIVFASAPSALADPIIILTDQRLTRAFANPGPAGSPDTRDVSSMADDSLSSTATASSSTGSGVSSATLTSSYADLMHWFGTAGAGTSWSTQEQADYRATSFFGVRFLVTAPVNYAFHGNFSGSSSLADPRFGSQTSGAGVALQRLVSPASQTIFGIGTPILEAGESDALERTFAGLLTPGDYFLSVSAGTSGSIGFRPGAGAGQASFAFTFDLSAADSAPVPEPASLLLLGTGVAVFGLRRASHRTRPGDQEIGS
jgi:PEP-CTERM motif